MAKKATAKPAAKRKPRAKKPVQPDLPDGKYNAVVWNPELEMYVVTPLPRDAEKAVIDQAIKEAETHLVKPAVKSSSLWRRLLFGGAVVAGLVVSFGGGVWSAGGIDVGPKPKNDIVSKVFDAQEAAFRELSPERAKALRAGEIKSEAESVTWMSSRFLPKAEAAWTPLLTAEKAAFGGEQWTAEKEAKHIEEYAR